jgi:hypothetical protein
MSNQIEYKGEMAMKAVEHFIRWLFKMRDTQRTLYCIAVSKWNGKFWEPAGFEYTHADDALQARLNFFQGNDPFKVQATMVAPVVGYFVNKERQDGTYVLSV